MTNPLLTILLLGLSLNAFGQDTTPFAKLLSCYKALPGWIFDPNHKFHEHNFADGSLGLYIEGDKNGARGLYFFSSSGSYFQTYKFNPTKIPKAPERVVEDGLCLAQSLPGTKTQVYELRFSIFSAGHVSPMWSRPLKPGQAGCEQATPGITYPANEMKYQDDMDSKYIAKLVSTLVESLLSLDMKTVSMKTEKKWIGKSLKPGAIDACKNIGYPELDRAVDRETKVLNKTLFHNSEKVGSAPDLIPPVYSAP